MEVKSGYKQTEVGVIPEDWVLRPLLNAVRVASGQVDPTSDPYRSMMLVAPDHIESGSGRLRKRESAGDQRAISGKYLFKTGDIVYSKIRPHLRKAFFADFDGLCSADMYPLHPAADVSAGFVFAVILGEHFSQFAESVSVRSGMPKINRAELAQYTIALPPTKAEQEAIAEALSDADALIASLEQLIAKKRYLKQGAMQELLTGKKRLPGFEIKAGYKQTEVGELPADWGTPELGGILTSMQLGGNYKNSERETSWPLVKMGNLGRGNMKLEKIEFVDSSQPPADRDKLQKDDVLFNTRNTLDLVGKVAIWTEELPEAYFNSNIMRMEFDETVVSSKRFMNYILNTPQSLKSLRGVAIGTTSVAAIYGRDLVKVRVPLPSKPEQIAIANVLTDMDAELAALEVKLTKSRQIKQGMMQEVLTGRIRLV
jgi:type I restriction enzyme S subunit